LNLRALPILPRLQTEPVSVLVKWFAEASAVLVPVPSGTMAAAGRAAWVREVGWLVLENLNMRFPLPRPKGGGRIERRDGDGRGSG
jgi:hypothetical protein